jgi:hypothetical protein
VRRPLAWLLGAVALLGFLHRRREPEPVSDDLDPRAEELRRKLADSRATEVEEEPEPGSVPAPPDDPESRRREVHESANETLEQMRRGR